MVHSLLASFNLIPDPYNMRPDYCCLENLIPGYRDQLDCGFFERQFQRDDTDGADIAALQALQVYGHWKREGSFFHISLSSGKMFTPPSNIPKARSKLSSPWQKTDQFRSFAYNNQSPKASNNPSAYGELLDPSRKNKLVLTQPNDGAAITYLYSVIIGKYDREWFEGLQKQNVKRASELCGREEHLVRSVLHHDLIKADNIANHPESRTRILWPQTAAIFVTTLRPESSKSDEYQQWSLDKGSYVFRKDLEGQTGRDWKEYKNRELAEQWRLQFEISLGVAKGASSANSF
ncbi:periplasmic binding protein-like II [Penicillium antarcticum]|uniref:periplasmic binding protein-like II n=1 Tax=Penicillium antarcticum TaxID=416450 RepID=UPI00239A1552|nr:periplasmic binding protein-like II [Penicillium antarcticum]KAJ5316854.1 periplasmic binding protein-like II [Penicillium antarcticum]